MREIRLRDGWITVGGETIRYRFAVLCIIEPGTSPVISEDVRKVIAAAEKIVSDSMK